MPGASVLPFSSNASLFLSVPEFSGSNPRCGGTLKKTKTMSEFLNSCEGVRCGGY